MSDGLLTGSIDEIGEQAQKIVDTIAPDIWCQAQEWDSRIDCMAKLPDSSVIGEMIRLTEATETRFKEAAERLLKRQQGIDVPLQNELRPPILITRANAAEVLSEVLGAEALSKMLRLYGGEE
jgi:hypothetical protein